MKQPYKVKKGQTLRSISEELGVSPFALVQRNSLQAEVFEGQLLYLPERINLYTVQVGDDKTSLCGGEKEYHRLNGTDVFYLGMRVGVRLT